MNIDHVGRCLYNEHRLFNYAYWRFCEEERCRTKQQQQQQQQQQQPLKGQQDQNTQNVKRSKVGRKADRRIGT